MSNAITTLVGEELEEGDDYKWSGTLAAPNGSLYGIPLRAGRVAKFNPVDKSMTHIGPNFGAGAKWNRGAMTDSGIILHVTIVVAFSRLTRILTMSQSSIEIFFQNEVMLCGDHVLPLSMDAFTSCLARLVV